MTVEMLNGIFETIQRCDCSEAMTVAIAALQHANKMQRGKSGYSTQEEFLQWFEQTVRAFGERAVPRGNSFPNEWLSMSAG